MQVPDEEKRERIRRAAAELFAKKPYHRVKLAEIAAAAGVGKGTIYVYFEDKDDLFLATFLDDLSGLVARLKESAKIRRPPPEALREVVRGLVEHAFEHSQAFELLRTVGIPTKRPGWAEWHRELVGTIEEVLRRGVREGVFEDPRPDLTALFVPGFVRSAMVYGPPGLTPEAVADHILRILVGALAPGGRS